jgi:hypothetical protein
LSHEARDLVLEHCLRERDRRIDLFAAVVMPDHGHLLLPALRDENGWPSPRFEIRQCLKSGTAHRINKLLHRSGPVCEKWEYIRQNPVRAGLVEKPEDYRWLWVNPKYA